MLFLAPDLDEYILTPKSMDTLFLAFQYMSVLPENV